MRAQFLLCHSLKIQGVPKNGAPFVWLLCRTGAQDSVISALTQLHRSCFKFETLFESIRHVPFKKCSENFNTTPELFL